MGNFAVNNEQQQYSRGDLLATLVPLIEAIIGSSSAFITRTVTTSSSSSDILIDNNGRPITTLLITFSYIQGGNNMGCIACNDNVYYSPVSLRNEETLLPIRNLVDYGTYSLQTHIGAKFIKIISGNGSPVTFTYTVR